MSHPLGALADNMTAYAIYATAQSEMRHAYALIEIGELDAAANEVESAAHAAEVLAKASSELGRIAHWRKVATARQRFVDQLRAELVVAA
jgi:hypothetical protein